MKNLYFQYSMDINFDNSINSHSFKLKCVPISNAFQTIENLNVNLIPKTALCKSSDYFGNVILYGRIEEAHDKFLLSFSGNAVVGAGINEVLKEFDEELYLIPTDFTKNGDFINKFYSDMKLPKDESNFQTAVFIMNYLYENFTYKQGVTNIYTTAENALKIGCGVCQDYSHIFISLCRLAGIPSRYVTGMLIGEGATHAWVEIADGDKWFALDPTNNCVVSDEHIKISCGRDCKDCVVNKGVFFGNASQNQIINVTVEEKFDGSDSCIGGFAD